MKATAAPILMPFAAQADAANAEAMTKPMAERIHALLLDLDPTWIRAVAGDAGKLLIVQGTGDPAFKALTGDVSLTEAGVSAIGNEKVKTAMLAALAVTEAILGNESVATGKVKNLAVTAAKLAAEAVEEAKIKALAVSAGKLAGESVEEAKLKALAVSEGKLAALSVATGKIQNLAVTAEKLGALAVETAKLANLAVTTEKLANLAVTSEKLGNEAVTEAKISDGAATPKKVSSQQSKNSAGVELATPITPMVRCILGLGPEIRKIAAGNPGQICTFVRANVAIKFIDNHAEGNLDLVGNWEPATEKATLQLVYDNVFARWIEIARATP